MPVDSVVAGTWVVAAAMEAADTGKQGFRFFLAELISPKWDGLWPVPLFLPCFIIPARFWPWLWVPSGEPV
jgi:hypothetical protein